MVYILSFFIIYQKASVFRNFLSFWWVGFYFIGRPMFNKTKWMFFFVFKGDLKKYKSGNCWRFWWFIAEIWFCGFVRVFLFYYQGNNFLMKNWKKKKQTWFSLSFLNQFFTVSNLLFILFARACIFGMLGYSFCFFFRIFN